MWEREGVLRTLLPVECCLVFSGPGGDLLFRVLRRSTIGAEGFHGRVRDGIGCMPLAMTTRPRKDQMSDDRYRVSGIAGGVSSSGACRCVRRVPPTALPSTRDDGLRHRTGIKPIERLVPVGASVAALAPPAYRRDGLSRLLGETWF